MRSPRKELSERVKHTGEMVWVSGEHPGERLSERKRPVGGAVLITPGFSLGWLAISDLHPVVGAASTRRCSD